MRRNADGFIEHSTCVNNTASEHFMVERLIVDDLLHWAVDYKVRVYSSNGVLNTSKQLLIVTFEMKTLLSLVSMNYYFFHMYNVY